ncbi:MAG: ATP-binding protein [Candidatus Altiarchaeota archaeon]|nr:ATP-binding protein [Candidatus Altiarchaeota archaeon]
MSIVFGRGKSLLKKYGMKKTMYLGKTEEGKDLYVDSLKPHVIFICGARGSGKSYTMGVFVEELAAKNDAVAVIVIDPVGVFWSMRHKNKQEREIELLKNFGLDPKAFKNIRVMVPIGATDLPEESYDGFFSIKPSELTANEWSFTFDLDTFSPAGLLISSAIAKAGEEYSIDDINRVIDTDPELHSKERGFSKQTRRGIISRMNSSKVWGIFSDKATSIESIAKAGEVTILDISFLEESVAALVVGIIARKALNKRKLESRKESLGHPSKFPPVWMFIDEAHTMAPKDRKTAASESLIEYVKQGRKPGCSLVLATQQPSAINSEVLSQLDIMCVHQLVFEDDIRAVSKRMPANVPKEWNIPFIRSLKTGQVIIGDRETTKVDLVMVRPRQSQHEGRSTLALERPQEPITVEDIQDMKAGKDLLEDGDKPSKKTVEEKPKKKGKRLTVLSAKTELEAAEKLARKKLDKLFFINREKFLVKMKVYWPYWMVTASSKEGPLEFLFDGINGEFMDSKGLQTVLDLNPISIHLLSHSGMTAEEISKKAGLEPRLVRLYFNKLIRQRLAHMKGQGDKAKYYSRVNVPEEIKSQDYNLTEVPPEGRILPHRFEPDKKLSKLYNIRILSKELIFVPYAYFKTDKKKELLVNLSTGKVEQKRLRLKV